MAAPIAKLVTHLGISAQAFINGMKKARSHTRAYKAGMKRAKTQTDSFNRSMGKAAKGAALLVKGFLGLAAARKALQFAERGARLSLVSKSFQALVGKTAEESERLARGLVDAASGTITFVKAQEIANRALGSGLNLEQVTTAVEFISKKSITTGKNAQRAIDTVITGLSRGSTLFLDDFGILVDGLSGVARTFDAIEGSGAFKSLGPAAQKAETIRQAVVEMREQMDSIGVSGKELAFTMAATANSVTDAVDKISQGLSGIASSLTLRFSGTSLFLLGVLKDIVEANLHFENAKAGLDKKITDAANRASVGRLAPSLIAQKFIGGERSVGIDAAQKALGKLRDNAREGEKALVRLRSELVLLNQRAAPKVIQEGMARGVRIPRTNVLDEQIAFTKNSIRQQEAFIRGQESLHGRLSLPLAQQQFARRVQSLRDLGDRFKKFFADVSKGAIKAGDAIEKAFRKPFDDIIKADRSSANSLFASTRTATEKLRKQLFDLQGLFRRGLDKDLFGRGLEQIRDAAKLLTDSPVSRQLVSPDIGASQRGTSSDFLARSAGIRSKLGSQDKNLEKIKTNTGDARDLLREILRLRESEGDTTVEIGMGGGLN